MNDVFTLIESIMYIVMNTYKNYGAYDTKSREFLTNVLNEIYGE